MLRSLRVLASGNCVLNIKIDDARTIEEIAALAESERWLSDIAPDGGAEKRTIPFLTIGDKHYDAMTQCCVMVRGPRRGCVISGRHTCDTRAGTIICQFSLDCPRQRSLLK